MKCPGCETENPEDAELCLRCGRPLSSLPAPLISLRAGQGIFRREITPRTRLCLFLATLNLLLFSYVLLISRSPGNSLSRTLQIFGNIWADSLLMGIVMLMIAFCLFSAVDFLYRTVTRMIWQRVKIGKLMVHEGYVTREEIEDALEEQKLRIGEILIKAGLITPEQLEDTLRSQKKTRKKLGDILKDKGYLNDQNIHDALNRMDRRLGEILRDKGLLTDHELDWILCLQKYGPRQRQ